MQLILEIDSRGDYRRSSIIRQRRVEKEFLLDRAGLRR